MATLVFIAIASNLDMIIRVLKGLTPYSNLHSSGIVDGLLIILVASQGMSWLLASPVPKSSRNPS